MSTVEPPRPPTPSALPPSSRYASSDIASMEVDGIEVRYYRRRFIPTPDEHAVTHEREVHPADRLDTIAAIELGDAELWWRIADANHAMRPADLTARPGRRLHIGHPLGPLGEPT